MEVLDRGGRTYEARKEGNKAYRSAYKDSKRSQENRRASRNESGHLTDVDYHKRGIGLSNSTPGVIILEDATNAKRIARGYVAAGKIKKAIELYRSSAELYNQGANEVAVIYVKGHPNYDRVLTESPIIRDRLDDRARAAALKVNRTADRLEKVLKEEFKPLSRSVATTAIISLVGGAFFLSSNMTGNVIGLSSSSSNILGSVLLVIGLVACFSWVKSKKKVVKKSKKKK